MKVNAHKLPLWQSLAWILASVFFFTGPTFLLFKKHLQRKNNTQSNPQFFIHSIIQTGPERQALSTECLAEILQLSTDRPTHSKHFDAELGMKRLQQFPLIASCTLRVVEPDALFIDYTVRQPIAWLEDCENVVIDKDGYPFPFAPFFSPKNLPSLYLGLQTPGHLPVQWNQQLRGKAWDLSLKILQLVSTPAVRDLFQIRRIDVSQAFAESYGKREIVLITEGETASILRLSTKNYAKELGDYLELRPHLGDEGKERIIDLRLEQLAFIDGM